MLTHARLLEVLDYDPTTGVFTWKWRPIRRHRIDMSWNMRFAGTVAGGLSDKGYVKIGVDCTYYMAHRLAWFYVKGEWPRGRLDHRDRNRSHNVIDNLRPATASQNAINADLYAHSTTGAKGVDHHMGRYWRARISFQGRLISLGYFPTKEAAAAARQAKAEELFGDFARAA